MQLGTLILITWKFCREWFKPGLNFDHRQDLEVIKKAINLGYSSIMVDGSKLDLKKNIRLTKTVVQLAQKKGLSVEAELGTIGGAEDLVSAKKIIYTDPEAAREFVELTGCDFLAVAIGTSHGAYKFKGTGKLRLDLMKKII